MKRHKVEVFIDERSRRYGYTCTCGVEEIGFAYPGQAEDAADEHTRCPA